jgi:hypothetical protein
VIARRSVWTWITIYAGAMALVEAACVVTLKRLFYPGGWAPPFPPMPAGPLLLEQVREVATLVMIATVALMAGRSTRGRVAAGLWIFGVWDILYYAFLRWLTGFPRSLADVDVVFLVPIAWIFPVWVPLLVSAATLVLAVRLRATVPDPSAPPPAHPKTEIRR